MTDLKQGTPIRFRDGADVLDGVINGAPFVAWDEREKLVRSFVPVLVDGWITVEVAGGNVYEVAAA